MKKILNSKKQKGFTLIEAMIAVVVFSFGLLGVAGVMTVAVKGNHNGYMRSQAIFFIASMSDMMRANAQGVIAGAYNGTYSGTSDVSGMCTAAPCLAGDLVARDTQQWSNMITQVLPNSQGVISCSPHIGLPTDTYSGICEVTITWDESNDIDASSTQTARSIVKPIL